MQDPYRQKRDFSRVGLIVVGALALILVALMVFYVFRPGPSAGDLKSQADLTAQMDRSQARSDAANRDQAAEQAKLLQ